MASSWLNLCVLICQFALFHSIRLRGGLEDKVQATTMFSPGQFAQLMSQADQTAVDLQSLNPFTDGFSTPLVSVEQATLTHGPHQISHTTVTMIRDNSGAAEMYPTEKSQSGTKWTNFPKIEGAAPGKKQPNVVKSPKQVYKKRKFVDPDQPAGLKMNYEEVGSDVKEKKKGEKKEEKKEEGEKKKGAVKTGNFSTAMSEEDAWKFTGMSKAHHMSRLQTQEYIDQLMKEADSLKAELNFAQQTTNSASMKENQRLLNLYGKLKQKMHDALMDFTPPDIFNEGYPKPQPPLVDPEKLAGTWVEPGSLQSRGTPPTASPMYPPFDKVKPRGEAAAADQYDPTGASIPDDERVSPAGTDVVTGPLTNPMRPKVIGAPKPVLPYH